MKRRARCWRCVAFGLLASAVIHAAAAAWWLRGRNPPAAPQDTLVVELDLAAFETPAGSPADALPREAPPAEPVAEPLVQPPPEPEPEEEPQPAPEPEPQVQPEEPTVATTAPEPEVTVQPSTPAPEKRSVQQTKRPKKEIPPRPTKPKKPRQKPTAVKPKPPPQRKVAPADLKRDAAPTASARSDRDSAGSASTSMSKGLGGASSARSVANAEAAYLAALQRAISRHQRFPDDARRRHKTGVVTLSFVVQGDGRIRQVRVTKSSGDASLDEAAMQALQRLNRFKPIPAVIGRSEWPMRVPIRFDLK